jgi:N-acetylglucosaminyldiphosphoundecaprenol N-acetyl-beta-D-mannosaminyltransferase
VGVVSVRDREEARGVSAARDALETSGASGSECAALFGVSYFRGTLADATALVVQAAMDGSGGYACLCNVHVLETAHRDADVMSALDAARVVFPDGAPIVWAQRMATPGPNRADRIGGPDLMAHVLSNGCAQGLRHALYGSTDAVLERLRETVEDRYPGVQIVASVAPPFGSRSEHDVMADVAQLRAAQPHVVWVALGAPRQELWAARYAHLLEPAFVVGVGAAFEFLAGVKPRAPRWMRRAGLEWLHRLASEPGRLGRRYVITNTQFLVRVASSVVRRPRRERHPS